MDEPGPDGTLRHEVPVGNGLRVFLVVCGVFVIAVSTLELHRGVWPINIFTPFFGFILAGAFSVGIPMLLSGLAGSSLVWRVGPGRIEIETTNPFRRKVHAFTPGMVADFTLREHDHDNGPNTWSVEMKTIDGLRFPTRDLNTREAADALRRRIEAAFRPDASSASG